MAAKLLTKTKSTLRKIHYQRRANFYLTLTALLFVGLTYLCVTNYLELSEKKEIVGQSGNLTRNITTELDDVSLEYESVKDTHNTLRETVKNEIRDVFPDTEKYTELTRELDTYFKSKNTLENPLVATNLQYGEPRVSGDDNYYILPVTMTIASSEANFFDFLSHINESGALSSKTRIMDIESIKINFRAPKGAKKSSGGEEINFNVQLNAYYQKIN